MENKNLIKVVCHTNLDKYQHEVWPEFFTAPPRIGEKVKAERGRDLKICSITHAGGYNFSGSLAEPFLIIELNL